MGTYLRQGDLFYSAGLHGNHVLATVNTGKIERGFGENVGERTGRVEISKEEIPGSRHSMHGFKLPQALKGGPLICGFSTDWP